MGRGAPGPAFHGQGRPGEVDAETGWSFACGDAMASPEGPATRGSWTLLCSREPEVSRAGTQGVLLPPECDREESERPSLSEPSSPARKRRNTEAPENGNDSS